MRRIIALPLFLFAFTLITFAAGRDRLSIDTYLDWEYVNSPQISPDGAQIVYTRRWTDKMNDKYEDEVWIMNADGTRNRFLVRGSQPRWSPDGQQLAYAMLVPSTQQFKINMPQRPAGARWVDAPRLVDRLDYRNDG